MWRLYLTKSFRESARRVSPVSCLCFTINDLGEIYRAIFGTILDFLGVRKVLSLRRIMTPQCLNRPFSHKSISSCGLQVLFLCTLGILGMSGMQKGMHASLMSMDSSQVILDALRTGLRKSLEFAAALYRVVDTDWCMHVFTSKQI